MAVITQFFRQLTKKSIDFTGIRTVSIATIAITSILLGVRQIGGLQPLELMAYDQMVRLRPDRGPDPRLLVVEITESDIQHYQKWPLQDELVYQLFKTLSDDQARVIGLDLYRDLSYPPGTQKLQSFLQTNNHIIVIHKLADDNDNQEGISVPAPQNIPKNRIGFNDFLIDPDGTVRRNLMFTKKGSARKSFFSFSIQITLSYLRNQNIKPQISSTNSELIRWGKAEFIPLQSDSGGYQVIDSQGYQILLDYRSDEKVARTVTLRQVLEKKIDPNWVKDKIVLIGTTAPSAKDLFRTPYSPIKPTNTKMPGVLVHAQHISQLLDAITGERPLFWFWPEWAERLWIGSWALIGSTLAWCSRHPISLGLGNVLLLGILNGMSFYLFTQYRWVQVVSPTLSMIFSGATVIAYRAHRSQQQRQIVMRLLGQNTSPAVAQALWQSRDRLLTDGKLPGQKLIATILFTDLKGFSTIAEKMPPEKLMEWLNEYLSGVTQLVQSHRGIINKFTGDGIMAAFGVPIARTTEEEIADDARNAVLCSLAMGEHLETLNQDWEKRGLPTMQMRVGIYTGPIVAGSLGGKERLEYGLLGDTVNIASRLESCEKNRQPSICRVLIAYETLIHVKDEFKVESWGHLALKGKEQTIDVYQVIGKMENSTEMRMPN